jgi:mannose-6-phosphate isomerase-like protein (cupin superfamily)
MDIRCVITGQTESGKSVFVRDEPVAPVTLALLPGFEFHRLWGSESVVELPSEGTAPPHPGYFPPANGFRFGFFTIPPEAEVPMPTDMTAAFAELDQKLPGLAEALEPGETGMHTTDTVDFDVVISGEVYLELDDGSEVLLKAGDCVVQNGTRHAWRNRSAANCVIAVMLVGANRTVSVRS